MCSNVWSQTRVSNHSICYGRKIWQRTTQFILSHARSLQSVNCIAKWYVTSKQAFPSRAQLLSTCIVNNVRHSVSTRFDSSLTSPEIWFSRTDISAGSRFGVICNESAVRSLSFVGRARDVITLINVSALMSAFLTINMAKFWLAADDWSEDVRIRHAWAGKENRLMNDVNDSLEFVMHEEAHLLSGTGRFTESVVESFATETPIDSITSRFSVCHCSDVHLSQSLPRKFISQLAVGARKAMKGTRSSLELPTFLYRYSHHHLRTHEQWKTNDGPPFAIAVCPNPETMKVGKYVDQIGCSWRQLGL